MDQRLELAAHLLQLHKVQEARILLESIVKDNRHDIAAWQLYAETWTDPAKRKRILESCLRLNPSSPQAQYAFAALAAGGPEAAPVLAPAGDLPAVSRPEQVAAKPGEAYRADGMPAPLQSSSGKAAAQVRRPNPSFWIFLAGAVLLAAMVLAIALALFNPIP